MKKSYNYFKQEICRQRGYANWAVLVSYHNQESVKQFELQALKMFAQQFDEFYK